MFCSALPTWISKRLYVSSYAVTHAFTGLLSRYSHSSQQEVETLVVELCLLNELCWETEATKSIVEIRLEYRVIEASQVIWRVWWRLQVGSHVLNRKLKERRGLNVLRRQAYFCSFQTQLDRVVQKRLECARKLFLVIELSSYRNLEATQWAHTRYVWSLAAPTFLRQRLRLWGLKMLCWMHQGNVFGPFLGSPQHIVSNRIDLKITVHAGLAR